ncbi:DUF4842 domain-containing protein [Bacteroides heparinolyticus]|uniref:DUF4842 domain-containing protein n=3 Tax=Prevotella heparinolytica TaxID=28113 RepID=A0A3P2ACR7_9BACE|nr:DUF4842 domain-containing protein [Bacteroides heparinolyticus]RRD91433.1 DUF4842 domain-containing protein [Bacteroides heparinolyticus]
MKSKKMIFFRILPILAIGGIFTFIGCDSSNDVYNPDAIKEQAKNAFPVKDIDPNQTWETSSVCKANVSVNETAGEVYTIKVYTANPYNANSGASLLATSSVSNGQTTNIEFDIPAALQYVYVMKIDSKGYSSAKAVLVENKQATVSFGGINNIASTVKTKAVSTIVNFTAPDASQFPTKEVAQQMNLQQTNGQIGTAGNYEIKSSVNAINNWAGNANLYITEDVTLNSLYITTNSKIFVLPGITLTLNLSGYSLGQTGSVISVGEGAKLILNSGRLQASNATIYNAGTVKAEDLDVAGNGYVYNRGTLSITKSVTVANYNSLLVNEGTMTALSFETQGSSSFYNSDKVEISGKSHLSSNNQKWENQGYFKTNSMVIEASSSNLLNACQLYIDGEFKINTTSTTSDNAFKMDGGAYTECGSLYLDNASIVMGGKSFFNVKGTATYNYNLGGFYATAQDFAILKIGKAVQNSAGQGNTIGYHGKLYVACNDHFENGLSGNVHYIIWEGDAQLTGADNAEISIPSSNCNPGYNSKPDNGGNDTPATYAYAFEDMMKEVGDYDFNDVVLYVSVPYDKNGKKVIDVTLKAAGATKKLAVGFNNSGQKQTLFADVHEALGVAAGTLVNTGTATGTEKKITVEVASNFTLTEHGDFYITDGSIERHIPNFTDGFKPGDVPYGIRIASSNWKWPKERVVITEAYAGFAAWANDATAAASWYNEPINGKVY